MSSCSVAFRSRRRGLWLALFLIWTVCTASATLAETSTTVISGSGVVIGAHEILTNAHVVKDCTSKIIIRSSSIFSRADVVALDDKNDLAVIHSDISLPTAVSFRDEPVRPGDEVIALGYPLAGILASSVKLTVGNVSALAGLGDDSRYLQISAPIQPGNSGGPLLDTSGHLVGIVSDEINALGIAGVIGRIPQNVNFALKTAVLRTFLDSQGIAYQTSRSEKQLSPADVGDIGRPFTVQIACSGPDVEAETSPPVEARPPVEASPHVQGRPHVDPLPPPPVQPIRILPACESPAVTNMLMRIGLRNRIAVFGVYARTLSGTADIHFCRALVSSSVGNRIVNYTVSWQNREVGQFWVQVTWYSGPLLSSAPPAPRLPSFAWPRWRR